MNSHNLRGDALDSGRIFRLLLMYRWINLIPALAVAISHREATWLAAGAIAILVNALITSFPDRLNNALRRRPWLLLIDLLACAAIVYLTGGWQTPFYIYLFSP